jgi:transcriptional regulator with XRE-family HTH domain
MNEIDVIRLSRARALVASGAAAKIRRRAGLAQAEVARAVGVAPSTVLRWERGLRIPRGDAAARYAELLKRLLDPEVE